MKIPLAKPFLLLVFGAVLFYSCEESSEYKPGYSGSFGELILVVEKGIWNSPIGDSLYNSIGAFQYGMPQDERQFNIIHVEPTKFKSVLRQHRSVLTVNIIPEYKEPLVLEKSKWAKGQVVVNLYGKDHQDLKKNLDKYGERIVDVFRQSEYNRQYLRNKKFGAKTTNQDILDKRKLVITSQKDVYLEKNDSLISWIRLERERPKGGFKHQISQGVLLFDLPYTDKLMFLDTNIYQAVDSVLKLHLPGPGKGQYMRLNFRYIKPLGKEVNFKGSFGKEYRGLWRIEGNAMGGPMYLLTFLDEGRQRVVYAFGYVFAPQFEKREYLREVEGMIQTIELP